MFLFFFFLANYELDSHVHRLGFKSHAMSGDDPRLISLEKSQMGSINGDGDANLQILGWPTIK